MTDNVIQHFCGIINIPIREGVSGWVIHLPTETILLCLTGEASVELTESQITTQRSLEAWQMLLISKGMMGDTAAVFAEWLQNISTPAQPLALLNETETIYENENQNQSSN